MQDKEKQKAVDIILIDLREKLFYQKQEKKAHTIAKNGHSFLMHHLESVTNVAQL